MFKYTVQSFLKKKFKHLIFIEKKIKENIKSNLKIGFYK